METGRYFDYVLAALIFYTIIIFVYDYISGKPKSKSKVMSSSKGNVSKIGMTDVYMVSFGDSITGYRSYNKRK